jgi:hypothetical protein
VDIAKLLGDGPEAFSGASIPSGREQDVGKKKAHQMHGVRCKFKLRPMPVGTAGVRGRRGLMKRELAPSPMRLSWCVDSEMLMEPLGMKGCRVTAIAGYLAMPGRTAFQNHGTVGPSRRWYGIRCTSVRALLGAERTAKT